MVRCRRFDGWGGLCERSYMFHDLIEEIRYEVGSLDEGVLARAGHFGREALAKVGYKTKAKKHADARYDRFQKASDDLSKSDPKDDDHGMKVALARQASGDAVQTLSRLGDTKRAGIARQTKKQTSGTIAATDAEDAAAQAQYRADSKKPTRFDRASKAVKAYLQKKDDAVSDVTIGRQVDAKVAADTQDRSQDLARKQSRAFRQG